jgi:hypothetical protein
VCFRILRKFCSKFVRTTANYLLTLDLHTATRAVFRVMSITGVRFYLRFKCVDII